MYLYLNDLVKTFPARGGSQPVTAVNHVSLSIEKGELVTLLGPSGCGKTTVLRCIAGFEPVKGGTISLGGRVVSRPGTSVPPEERSVGMVFQDFALFPHLTVARNVAFGLRRHATDAAQRRVDEMLELIGLKDAGGAFPHELSGGQQQRVAVARALVLSPPLVLADEPTGNLDTESGAQVFELLRDVSAKHRTAFLVVTHDERIAARCDRVLTMVDGRIRSDVRNGRP